MRTYASFQIVGSKTRRKKGLSSLLNLIGIARSPKMRQTRTRNFYISKLRTLNFWNSYWKLFGDITWRTAMRYSWFSSQGLWTEWPQPWRSSNHSEPSRSGRCRRGKSALCRSFTQPMSAGLLNLWFSIALPSVSRSGGSTWNFPGDLRPLLLSKNTFRRLISQHYILRRASTWILTSSSKSRVRAWDLSNRTSSLISDIPMSKNNPP